jgi:hypothetical protein
MTGFTPELATKPRQNGATHKNATAPVQVPVEVREQSKKPKRLEVITTKGISKAGKPFVMMVPAPGFAIARVIFTDLDQKRRLARTIVIAEKRKGRPHNSQRRENGGTEA